jgi:hypothetical protein
MQNSISELLHQVAASETVNRAKRRFAWQPFHQRYKTMLTAANVGRGGLPGISVCLGLLFVTDLFLQVIPWPWLAWLIAGLFLPGWELVKGHSITIFWESKYAGGLRSGWPFAIFTIILIAGSLFASVEGARLLHSKTDTTMAIMSNNHTAEMDSVKAVYASQVAAIDDRIKAIEKHKGKRWGGLLSGSENAQILNYQKEIEAIRQNEGKALAAIQTRQQSEFLNASDRAGFNLIAVLCLAILIDVLILLAGWFSVYYDYATAKQADRLQAGSQRVEVSVDDLQSIVQHLQYLPSGATQVLAENKPPKIGFSLGRAGTKISTESDKNGDSSQVLTGTNAGAKQDVAGAIAAIRAGVTDRRYLMKNFRLNVATANELVSKYHNQNQVQS